MTTKPLIGNFSSVGDTAWTKADGTSLGNINATSGSFTFGQSGFTGNHTLNAGQVIVASPSTGGGSTYNANGQSWQYGNIGSQVGGPSGANSMFWYEATGGKFVGGISTAGAWSLGDPSNASFPGNNIVGRKDGSAVPAGYVGQVISAVSAEHTPNAQDAWHPFASNSNAVLLTPGNWQLFGAIAFDNVSFPGYKSYWGAWSLVNGSNSPTFPTPLVPTSGINNIQIDMNTQSFAKHFLVMSPIVHNVSSNLTVYLNANSNQNNGAAARVTAYITAIRIA